ncbi:zinc ribbon domain-containing protein [Thomasclavelia sp.]|uniref:zinc ribbon domain-containing protein n=1 Tax=Thomasclavelia sp. TaxID=3025757 RepID=UPI0025EDF026|nr:zinc ribbon domain-containing protein [Thomasclavelia sp.]
MFCTNCGKQIPDDVRFCPECGAQINNQQADPFGDQNIGFNNQTNQTSNYNSYQQMNNQSNFNNFNNYNGAFRWGAGAIIWFVILILGCIFSIYQFTELMDYNPYLQLYGFNITIVLAAEAIALISLIILIIKRMRVCVYVFYAMKVLEVAYTYMQLGAYFDSSYTLGLFIGMIVNVGVTYLVLRNYWHQLS